ncbi:hypothetical protein [Treponema sp.]|uniref:hypothetical protein n=1 Tax=Treponema sp. TaxID=166 RepID=UPI003F0B1B04
MYHYAGNNPVKYTDPDGRWVQNDDGSYTAESGDTLWGLSQLTGRDWHDTDYSGKPEDLQVNQTVRFRSEFDLKFEGTKILFDVTVNTCTAGSQFLKNMANNGYTVATATSVPLKLLDDPFLLRDAETLKYYGEKIGKAALVLAFTFDLYDGIKTGVQTKSFWHGAYKTTTGALSTGVGYLVAGATSPFITPVGGVFAGVGTSLVLDYGFKGLEDFIWRKQ